LLDPACGSGTFLLTAVKRIRMAYNESAIEGKKTPAKAELLHEIFKRVVGVDLNPLAVMTARTNYLLAVSDLFTVNERIEIPVYRGDTILDNFASGSLKREQFDIIAGNPPWIAWDNLSADYRQATKPLWERYGLFSLSGKEARHGGAKKDLSMLMLYSVADNYLKPLGRLGFVITQTIFQTKGAGDGFRRFRLGKNGANLEVLRADDFVGLRPFCDAANWTGSLIIRKGRATSYPVPYFKWRLDKASDRSKAIIPLCFEAWPIDARHEGSPWFLQPKGLRTPLQTMLGPSDYDAHLGANTGGANGVYWLELLGAADGGVRVRNVPHRGKAKLDMIEAIIEPDLLFPLLRWRDVDRYCSRPKLCLLLTQDCATRTGIEQSLMRERYPRTLAFLEHFSGALRARAAYRRYQSSGPFYSMYNVGTYTIAPIKVVWRRMDRRLNAAVVTCFEDKLLGRRPLIPQETCVLIACESLREAHYLCALLNSSLVNYLQQAHSVRGGKSFGTPSTLEYLNIRRFDPHNRLHDELAACSMAAHRKMSAEILQKADALAQKLYGVEGDCPI
ncbi:MAG: Eco57I restriction-modification methylase domain-containing protein, partial [Thermoguttaceae bacterium]